MSIPRETGRAESGQEETYSCLVGRIPGIKKVPLLFTGAAGATPSAHREPSDQVDKIFEQPQPDSPALFRVELDAVHIIPYNGRGKGENIFRCSKRIFW